ncbi:MAG: 2-amino-4-oxopentanoate thiolase subunit OrtA [Eubacteriales bacterium]|nr:2-amino-4-oxopentanoate thiolase subunit OrtA [Eubacteriales bacterium]
MNREFSANNLVVLGDWVQVEITVLEPDERAKNIPDDTKQVPLQMWVKGYMQNESACMGDTVTVKTRVGRLVEGRLCAVNPCFEHNFGGFIPELLKIDDDVKAIVFGGENDD